MKLSIVIPCYNEIHTIETIVQKVLHAEVPLDRELIIVDDCSTDQTRAYLETLKDHEDIKIVLH